MRNPQPTTEPTSPPTADTSRGVSIRTVVALVTVLPAAAIAVALVTLLALTTDQVSERLEESMLKTATQQVRTDVRSFLGEAVRLSDLYARRAESGELPLAGLTAWERTLLDNMAVSPGIAAISYGSASGEAVMVMRHAGRFEVDRVSTDGTAHRFVLATAADPVGTAGGPARTYTFDPRKRPWYAAALASDKALWTPIYSWKAEGSSASGSGAVESEIGTGYARAIRDRSGSVLGVLVVDVTLSGMSTFLHSLPLAKEGTVSIVDERGLLVAASEGPVNAQNGDRLALEAASPAIAQGLQRAPGTTDTPEERSLRLNLDGGPVRVRSSPLRPYPGVEWRVVSAIPEGVLLGETRSLQRRAIWVSVIAVAAALVLGLLFSRRISKPVAELASHVQRVGAGEFGARLDLRAAREFKDLSTELNKMAGGLKHRVELEQSLNLAKEVQQGLLPRASPASPGLDIAGQSRYCDATGGDYFDFIEVAGGPGGQTLVAVGDVMGHGIASALLMATARGALRTRAAAAELSLGGLMADLNRLLAADTQGYRFMTMILLVVDPTTHTARWASAGHGPPLVYDPKEAAFMDVDGGDLPLGVDSAAEFNEYTINHLPENAVIVLGTDGIWEAADDAGKMFGEQRLRDVISQTADRPSAQVLQAIDDQMAAFCGTCPSKDDITAVVVRLSPPAPTATA